MTSRHPQNAGTTRCLFKWTKVRTNRIPDLNSQQNLWKSFQITDLHGKPVLDSGAANGFFRWRAKQSDRKRLPLFI
jgi:hypothetical protein